MAYYSRAINAALDRKYSTFRGEIVGELNRRAHERIEQERSSVAARLFGEEDDISEGFKRGDIVKIPKGAYADSKETFKAVMLSDKKAVYLDDDGNVEPVPSEALAKAQKARSTQKDKDLAAKYLENMR